MRQIKDYEGLYAVTKEGKVWSYLSSKFLAPKKHNAGYQMVCLNNCGHKSYRTIHRLVAESFLENFENKATVNHKDGNKKNNNVSNLEWSTQSENNKHAYEKGLNPGYDKKGSKHPRATLNETQVRVIKHILSLKQLTHNEIAIFFNVKKNTIDAISTGRNWSHTC